VKPFTREDADDEARAAILAGERDGIDRASRVVDAFDTRPSEQTPARTLSAALWYAEQGLHVFPLQPRSKVPHRGTRGFKDASTDEQVIRQWWDTWPDSNLAMATGHVVDVLDFDGFDSHVAWGQRYGGGWGGIERLAVVSTPRPGGLHIWRAAQGFRNRASVRRRDLALPGVDYRGLGGYVVLPPSTVTSPHAGTYRFIVPYQPREK